LSIDWFRLNLKRAVFLCVMGKVVSRFRVYRRSESKTLAEHAPQHILHCSIVYVD